MVKQFKKNQKRGKSTFQNFEFFVIWRGGGAGDLFAPLIMFAPPPRPDLGIRPCLAVLSNCILNVVFVFNCGIMILESHFSNGNQLST